jgi:DNA adenine methylase
MSKDINKIIDGQSKQYGQKKHLAKLKPIVKWVGGKGQLLNEIREKYPNGIGNTIKKYCEPFIGGGAVLFDILNNYELDDIYISDVNSELINTYLVVRDEVETLIDLLFYIQAEFIPMSTEQRSKYYYKKREEFNDLICNGNKGTNLKKAALFIFLNKTCFNGLYRVNKQGLFNVPIGNYKNPIICDEVNLRNISKSLQKATIVCGDYRDSYEFIDENTFVYFDPPYRPLTNTSSFTAYSKDAFNDEAQIKLLKYITQVNEKGAKFVISNSDPKNSNAEDNFFDELYAKYNIIRVKATRMINSISSQRGKINELLISNFYTRNIKKIRRINNGRSKYSRIHGHGII